MTAMTDSAVTAMTVVAVIPTVTILATIASGMGEVAVLSQGMRIAALISTTVMLASMAAEISRYSNSPKQIKKW